ncbi:MAG: PIN/TRAM domain-containing protein [Clostridia bacterium]|nr:PIN/TRAM domain-containing protein [Clostridia bacterium]
MLKKAARIVIALFFLAGGLSLGYALLNISWLIDSPLFLRITIIILPGIVLGLIGYSLAPWVIKKFIQMAEWIEKKLQNMPLSDLLGAALGLIIGLIIASLLGFSFARVPFIGNYVGIFCSILFGYLGLSLGYKKKEELLNIFHVFPKLGGRDKEKTASTKVKPGRLYKILDTSVIIDGRIADICKSGFAEGILVVPEFVLKELRHIADSSDQLRRNRGRRGLDILNKMRKELDVRVQICEKDFPEIPEVDSKLVRLAQVLGADIYTNDYNLNKVAELQGIQVLNINELANALKPIFLPGEEMVVQVIKDGKESQQGIGYLDDGTMIVVESGKKYINQNIYVVVTSVLQTAAGRMIFAKPKYNDSRTLYEVDDAIG